MRTIFTARLKAARERKGIMQKEAAKQANIAYCYYNFIENGQRRPSPEVAKRIAGVLGFPDKWYMLLENAPAEQLTLFSG